MANLFVWLQARNDKQNTEVTKRSQNFVVRCLLIRNRGMAGAGVDAGGMFDDGWFSRKDRRPP